MKGRPRLNTAPSELILVPLLDMVSLLVQVLLLNVQFGAYAELPATSVGGAGTASTEALALTIDVEARGFAVRWNEQTGARAELLPCREPCQAVADFPFDTLSALLGALKDQHPSERGAVVRPVADLPFAIIARTMDAARASGGRVLFPDLGLGGGP